jgi:hypothetical protein
MHYFLCSGGTGTDLTKTRRDMLCEIVFLRRVGSVGHVVHSSRSRVRYGDSLFFMLGWDQHGFDKKGAWTVTLNLCFCISWDLWVM